MKKKREPEYGQGMLRMWRQITAVRLHVYLVFVKSIEQELKIQ